MNSRDIYINTHMYTILIHLFDRSQLSNCSLQKRNLLIQEWSHIRNVEWTLGIHPLLLLFHLQAKSLLKQLHSVLCEPVVEFRPVANCPGAGQDKLIADWWIPRPKGSHHADSFKTSDRLERLMFNVSSLHNHSSALQASQLPPWRWNLKYRIPLQAHGSSWFLQRES